MRLLDGITLGAGRTAVEIELRRTLIEVAAWIDHWREDRRCKLMPTENSLTLVAEKVRTALARSEVGG